jgi:hypothetical protein
MALIYRSLFNVEADAFVLEQAPRFGEEWLRWKLKRDDLTLEGSGSVSGHDGVEALWTRAHDGDIAVFRIGVYEEREERSEQVRTTFTAFADGQRVWAQADIERWVTSSEAEPWLPLAPSIVSSLLDKLVCRRGPLRLPRALQSVYASGASALVAAIADPDRETPIVVLSANLREDIGDARRRGSEMAKSLAGIAPVFLLQPGAVSAFSKTALEQLGDRMDVYGGAARIYAPGAGGRDDSPYRHRLIVYRRFERRSPIVAARIVALPLLHRAAETPPPPTWRERGRPLLESTVGEDQELLELLEQESAELERDVAELREENDTLQERLRAAQSDGVELLTQVGDLQARVHYLRNQLAQHDGAAAYAEPLLDTFLPDFCSEVIDEAIVRLDSLVIHPSVRAGTEALDDHANESWGRKGWQAFQALDAYAKAKAAGFAGDFMAYCDSALDGAKVPKSWVGRHESQLTKSNSRFRELRTLPVAIAVDSSGKVLMEEHVKIEQGGRPAPRIHFYDDTGGPTQKIHVGWFGDHLDSRAKS